MIHAGLTRRMLLAQWRAQPDVFWCQHHTGVYRRWRASSRCCARATVGKASPNYARDCRSCMPMISCFGMRSTSTRMVNVSPSARRRVRYGSARMRVNNGFACRHIYRRFTPYASPKTPHAGTTSWLRQDPFLRHYPVRTSSPKSFANPEVPALRLGETT